MALLGEDGARVSMSRTRNPYENVLAELFGATLGNEEVYVQEYESLADAQRQIARFIEDVCNRKRLHFLGLSFGDHFLRSCA